MSTRKEIVSGFCGQYDEDGRTTRSRHGQLEFCTTMAYIHRYAAPGSRILEVGAGTGRYSIALAKEGLDVTAVELVESNLEALRKDSQGIVNLQSFQGDATDLSRFPDNSFDVTLSLGPMYHLYPRYNRFCRGTDAERDLASSRAGTEVLAPECLSGFGRSAVHRPVEGSDRCRLRSVCRGFEQGQDPA